MNEDPRGKHMIGPSPLKCGDYLFMGKKTENQSNSLYPDVRTLNIQFERDWHKIPIEELLRFFGTDIEKGLKLHQVDEILARGERNVVTAPSPLGHIMKFLKQLKYTAIPYTAVVIICFITASFPSLRPTGSYTYENIHLGALLLIGAFVVVLFCFCIEKISSSIMTSFRDMFPNRASLVRDGQVSREDVRDIVIGDLILLTAGDIVPADIRIIESFDFKTDESTLTFDPEPVEKDPHKFEEAALESQNLAFFGTYCVQGYGKGIVVSTGDKTVLGQVMKTTVAYQHSKTSLHEEVLRLVRFLFVFALCISVFFLGLSFYDGWFWVDSVVYILVLLIASMPEILVSGVTASLTLSAKRMASKNCLVRSLETAETLGSISIICCNKTGILTRNIMNPQHVWLDGKIIPIYDIKGKTDLGTDSVPCKATWEVFARAASLSTAMEWQTIGKEDSTVRDHLLKPLEHGIISFLKETKVDIIDFQSKYRQVFEVPFVPKNKFQLCIHEVENPDSDEDYTHILSLKGAPENILRFCSTILLQGSEEKIDMSHLEEIKEALETLMSYGEKVIGICDRKLSGIELSADRGLENVMMYLKDVRFLGFISFVDPIQEDVRETVENIRKAGIKVVLMTGSHKLPSKIAAREVGIISENSETRNELAARLRIPIEEIQLGSVPAVVIHSSELEGMSLQDLKALLSGYPEVVFARVSPEQKPRIVEAFQKMGEYVAITGSGLEDYLAMKQANIGIAMAKNSCDLCKREANLILLEDKFSAVLTAIKDGRLIYDNLRKSIAYILACKVPQIAPYFLFVLLNIPLPMGALFVILIFLITDMLPAMSLLYEKPESDILERVPRSLERKELISPKFMSKLLQRSCGYMGITEALAGIYTYFIIMAENGFMPRHLIGLNKRWYSMAINDLKDDFNQEWTYTARQNLEHTCQTAFFATVVVIQWFSLLICRTSRDSIWDTGMRNYAINFSIIFQTILTLLICYLPGTDFILHSRTIKFIWWLPGIPFGLFLLAYSELTQFIIRHSKPDTWIVEEAY